jgi:hypothetical protein
VLFFMNEILEGQLAQLPDGQQVQVEITHGDGYATVRLTEGERAGEIAVCKVASLLPWE